MIVLDTSVVSEVLARRPDPTVMEWLQHQDASSLHLSAATVAEVSCGIALLAPGDRRTALAAAWDSIHTDLADRVLTIGTSVAEAAGAVLAARRRDGRPISCADALIAGVCMARGYALATRNLKDFDGLGIIIIDPWTADPRGSGRAD